MKNNLKGIKIKRFVNYKNLCLFLSQIAHDYERLGYEKFMAKEYKCHGMYKRYLLGYKEYLTNKENKNKADIQNKYTGKFILDPYLYDEYFKFKNRGIIENANIIPELYNHGFIFTSVQEAVQVFDRGNTHEKGF